MDRSTSTQIDAALTDELEKGAGCDLLQPDAEISGKAPIVRLERELNEELMSRMRPQGLSRRRAEQLLSTSRDHTCAADRIESLSHLLLGNPYKPHPLIGSADTAEVFTVSLDGFDCVTYIETIVALARASNVDDFISWLRRIRYKDGRVQWERRNHYMTVWIRNNTRKGIIGPVSMPAIPIVSRHRVLNVVPRLRARRARVRCVPKRAVPRLEAHLHSGDLIFFASTRKNLDVYHAGIIVRDGNRVLMRHASRSQGFVVEQQLGQFLKANQMAGVIVVRPQEVTRFRQSQRRNNFPAAQFLKAARRKRWRGAVTH